MFEIINGETFVKIQYNQLHKKKLIEFFVGISVLLLGASAVMLLLHFFENVSVWISIIIALALVGCLIVFKAKYSDMKRFFMEFSAAGIVFCTKKAKIEARWREIENCGIITRTGSESIEDTMINSRGNIATNKKNTFYFTKNENPNLKKMVYHIRTTALVDHGIVKDMYYISEYRGAYLFNVILNSIDRFNNNPELMCLTQDRTNIKK